MKETEKYIIRFKGDIVIEDIKYYLSKREEFLKSKKVLTRFKQLEKEGVSWLEIENVRQLIDVFIWEDTFEGYSYWHKINTEWLEYLGIFGNYVTLTEYEEAKKKADVFKKLLDQINKDGFDEFKCAFNICNVQLSPFIEDTLIRTFLGGYGYAQILRLWLDNFYLSQPHWEEVLLILEKVDTLIYETNNDPKANASMLLASLCCCPELLAEGKEVTK